MGSSYSSGTRIVFRMPDGKNYEGNFQSDTSIKVSYIVESCKHPIDFININMQLLYQFVFVKSCLDGPFGIFTTYPRSLLDMDSDSESTPFPGVLIVEEGENLFDPLKCLHVVSL